jgi:hypothetical protein
MGNANDQRKEAYEASIVRLIQVNRELRLERKRLKWILVITCLVSPLVYFLNSAIAVIVALTGISGFFIGHYVMLMHIEENKLTIKSAKQSLASIDKPKT